MLFAVLATSLPIVLPEIVSVVPAVVAMPTKPCEMLVVEPKVVIEPMVLFEMLETVDAASAKIPELIAPLPEVVAVIDPVPVPLPIVFPLVVPMLALPLVR